MLFAVAFIAFVVLRSRRRRRKASGHGTRYGTASVEAELHNNDPPRTHGRSELSERRAPAELDAVSQQRAAGMEGISAEVAELRVEVAELKSGALSDSTTTWSAI